MRISFDQIPRQIRQPLTDAIIGTVSPLLEAIAEGRVFEVRPERCAMCGGRGHSSFCDGDFTITHDCPRCDGSGYEPAPPGRKQRTAYDAMIDGATGDGTLFGSTQPSGEASATLLAPAPPSRQ